MVGATQRQLLSAATFRTVAVWAIIPAVLAPLVVALGVREHARVKGPGTANRVEPSTQAALNPRFKRFLVVIVLFTLGNSSDAFLVLRAQSAGVTVLGVLGLLALFNLVLIE